MTFATFFIGTIGGILGIKRKIPAGALLGSMLLIALFNIITGEASFPMYAKVMTQTISGLFIGSKITRAELPSFKLLIKPAIINASVIIAACAGMGMVLYYITGFNLATSLFATAPGSLTDMAIISIDMGADTSVVSVLQLVRLLTILGIFPIIFRFILKKDIGSATTESTDMNILPQSEINNTSPKLSRPKKLPHILLTGAIAIAGGTIGYLIGFPAAPMVCSMFAVAAFNILPIKATAYMPIRLKQFAQICAGILIGQSVTVEVVQNLKFTIVPALIMIFSLLTIVIFLAYILHKTSGLDFPTALFSCAPGGAGDLALIADDFGASTPRVSIIQTFRVIMVVVIYPIIISIIDNTL